MKGPFGTLGVTKGPFGASGATPLANQPTASGVFPDARAGRKMVAGASARGHLVVPRVLAIFELASPDVLKGTLATGTRREGALRDVATTWRRLKGHPRDVSGQAKSSVHGDEPSM